MSCSNCNVFLPDSGEKKLPAMPGSPVDVKIHSRPTVSAMPPLPSVNPSGPRPAAFSSTALTNGMNHSPPTLNAVPSPPQRYSNGPSSSSSSSLANQQLPATCGARQLSKLKRFLTTLQQFGNDISPEIGESVRSLVLALVNSTVTIEEFHSRLQEATNFPLRPFVIPFLKANLPLLQRELLHCARAAKQTPAQYLSQHEHLLLSTAAPSPADSTELLLEPSDNKRHSPSRAKENGFHERPPAPLEPPAKRICTISPAPRHSPAHPVPLQIHPTPPPLQHYALDDITTPHLYREPHRILELRELKDRPRLPGTNGGYHEDPVDHRLTEREWADEWRHLDHVLNCIVDMVEKTRRSVSVLRRCQESDREELNYWRRRSSQLDGARKSVATPSTVSFSKSHSPLSADAVSSDAQRELSLHAGPGYVPDEIWRKAGHWKDPSVCWHCCQSTPLRIRGGGHASHAYGSLLEQCMANVQGEVMADQVIGKLLLYGTILLLLSSILLPNETQLANSCRGPNAPPIRTSKEEVEVSDLKH
ncbi:Protein CBFA2T2 [Bagarius yarrelli]|uniref:Protein CBFA2T2 n=1 Tax=Bagarius yarrelli TaxID=175774 RepID=A0A556VXP7_BAGYA|nr:Protein CBFA2T2 [Bagarius yarrelli]